MTFGSTFSIGRWLDRQETDRGGKILFHAVVFLIAFLILFSRRPDAILNAQFYAEDGKYWYADAYNLGWSCLLIPKVGYLQNASRLVALFSLLFPFAMAPLVMNLSAIAVQILPVHIFLSSRFNFISLAPRIFGGLVYLATPNAYEIHANTANIQWHLALAACLILLARPDDRLGWRIFDFAVLALLTFGSLLGLLLIPVAALQRWMRKDPRYNLALWVLTPGAMIQAGILLLTESRRAGANGATLARLADIVGGQVFFSSVLGVRTAMQLFFSGQFHSLFVLNLIALAIGLFFVAYALRYGPAELKLGYLFAGLVFAAALRSPLASELSNYTEWQQLEIPGCGNRYFFLPMVVFLATLVWMAVQSKAKFPRYSALAVMLLLPIGVVRDWQYKPFPDLHFQEYALEFNQAQTGTEVTIPINPGWYVKLTKH